MPKTAEAERERREAGSSLRWELLFNLAILSAAALLLALGAASVLQFSSVSPGRSTAILVLLVASYSVYAILWLLKQP